MNARTRLQLRTSSRTRHGAPIHLTKRDPARNLHRFYTLAVQPNLFGGCSLIRSWGRIGQPGQMRVELCADAAEAEIRYRKKLQEKHRRGYREGTAS